MTTEKLEPSDELVEIPTSVGKRHEPVIKGKGVPIWVLVSYAVHHHMTPEQISEIWDDYVTPGEVQAAIAYAKAHPELVDYKLGDSDNGLGD